MTREEECYILMRGLSRAFRRFYAQDKDLLPLGVDEKCLVGNLYRYFHQEVYDRFKDPDLRIDVEYDRIGMIRYGKPRMEGTSKKQTMRLDMVVHHRGNHDRNICAFEFKRYDRAKPKSIEEDRQKLRECVDPDWLGYHFGFFIVFGETLEDSSFQLFAEDMYEGRTFMYPEIARIVKKNLASATIKMIK